MPDAFNVLDQTTSAVLAAGTNNIGYVGTVPGQQVALGRFFLSSTGRVSLTAAGNFRATIQNPAGSGKTINLGRLAAFATGTGYAGIRLNPTTGLPTTTPRAISNAVLGGGVAPAAVLRVDTDLTVALSGGTDTGLTFGIPGGTRTSLDLPPLVLSAGQTMGLNVPFAGAADVTMSVYWWETPV